MTVALSATEAVAAFNTFSAQDKVTYMKDGRRLVEVLEVADTNGGPVMKVHDCADPDDTSTMTILPHELSMWEVVVPLGT